MNKIERNNLIAILIVALFLLLLTAYGANACRSNDSSGQSSGNTGQSEGSAPDTGSSDVAQADNSARDGNGGESTPLIKCDNIEWAEGLLPCKSKRGYGE